MQLSINVKKHSTYTCFEEVMSTVGDYYGLDISFYFLSTFGFRYLKEEAEALTLGSICISNGGANKESIECHCELSYKIYNRGTEKDNKEIDEIIENNINASTPVCIILDSYYLPWDKYFLRKHRKHFFLIIGIAGNQYICADPFLNIQKVLIERHTVCENCEGFVDFRVREHKNELLSEQIISSLKSYMLCNKNAHYTDIKKFASDISKMRFSDIDREKHYDLNESGLLFCLAAVNWSRIHFKSAIEYLSRKYKVDICLSIFNSLSDISGMWSKVNSFLMKSVYSDKEKFYLDKATHCLLDIAESENDIMEQILHL